MKIKFKQVYIGRETAMQQRQAGDIDEDMNHVAALELIAAGVVEEVAEVATHIAYKPVYIESNKLRRKTKEVSDVTNS